MTVVAAQVPGYELGELVGRGGFAAVYRAVQVAVGREVAVKIDNRMLLDERGRRRFLREVTAAGRLSAHPHVIGVYDAGSLADGRPYLVMELCPRGSLRDLVSASGPLSPPVVRDIGVGIADALAAAHAAGVLHRDIKPANILVNTYGIVGLSDFGLASILAPDGEQSATRDALTPAYAAPEVFAAAEPTVAADVYALSATLYMLLCGHPPHVPTDGRSVNVPVILAMHRLPLPDLPIDAGFMAVLRTGLHPDPRDRWASAGHLRDALAALPGAGGGAVSAVPLPAPTFGAVSVPGPSAGIAVSTSRRRWGVAALVAVGVVLVVAVLVAGGIAARTIVAATAGGPAAAPDAPSASAAPGSPVGDVMVDGVAVGRALALVHGKVGGTLRMTYLTAAVAGPYTTLTVDVRAPGDPAAIDRYAVDRSGTLTGPRDGSISALLGPGQNQLTGAIADAKTFDAGSLPFDRWRQVTAAVVARAAIRDGAVTGWAAYVFDQHLHIVFEVQSRYGNATVVTDPSGTITSTG